MVRGSGKMRHPHKPNCLATHGCQHISLPAGEFKKLVTYIENDKNSDNTSIGSLMPLFILHVKSTTKRKFINSVCALAFSCLCFHLIHFNIKYYQPLIVEVN